MKAWVYWNLHKDCWSVKIGKAPIQHFPQLTLSNVRFRVRRAGRERVNQERRKNVHAFAVGELVLGDVNRDGMVGVTYNPYKYETFVEVGTELPIYGGEVVVMYSEVVDGKVKPRVICRRDCSSTTPMEQTNANFLECGGNEVQRCDSLPWTVSNQWQADCDDCHRITEW